MNVTKRRLLLIVAAFWSFIALLWIAYRLQPPPKIPPPPHPPPPPPPRLPSGIRLAPSPTPPTPPPKSPRVSLIIIWENKYGPNGSPPRPLFPNLLQSFGGANRPYVQLVWIGLRQDDEERCIDPLDGMVWEQGKAEQPNVKVVCLNRKEYWTLHRDYFCAPGRWGCTETQSTDVLNAMLQAHDRDEHKSFFKIYRGYVFSRYMTPGAHWWGWTDEDNFMGNFRTQFPWEATAYDVFLPTAPDEQLLLLQGYLAFFRIGPKTEYKLLQYPDLKTVDNYLARPIPEYNSPEEAQMSAFILRNPLIYFLTLPHGLVHIPPHLFSASSFKFSTLSGAYGLSSALGPFPPIGSMPVLALPTIEERASVPIKRLFSEKGITRPVDLHYGSWGQELWFPQQFSTHYNHFHPIPNGWRRLVGRGGGYRGGEQGVWERLEPPREKVSVCAVNDPSFCVSLVEGLYVHWFEEKWNAGWYNNVTHSQLRAGQALVTAERYGAEVWDVGQGTIVWKWDGQKS